MQIGQSPHRPHLALAHAGRGKRSPGRPAQDGEQNQRDAKAYVESSTGKGERIGHLRSLSMTAVTEDAKQ